MSPQPLPWQTKVLIGGFALSGLIHLVKPTVFAPLIPRRLGEAEPWVYGTGVAELVCAGGLATRSRWAPTATTATLAVVWVGNWQMAWTTQRSQKTSTTQKVLTWARIPVQVPMMLWAWRSPTGHAAIDNIAASATRSDVNS